MSHAWPGIHGIDGRRARGPARQPDPRARRAQVALRRAAGAVRAAPSHSRRERRGVGRAARGRADARVALIARREAPDGTIKVALDARRGDVETVLIPGRSRSTVCVSSQAGCTRHAGSAPRPPLASPASSPPGRSSCSTWWRGRRRRPGAAAQRGLHGHGRADGQPRRGAGGGRPADRRGARHGSSARHVTVSTSGVVPGMERFLRECRAHLALSLNATTDAQRERLMPHNQDLAHRGAARRAARGPAPRLGPPLLHRVRALGGVNDSDADATRLAGLLAGLPAHVNLIPHNDSQATASSRRHPSASGVPAPGPRRRRAVSGPPAPRRRDRRGLRPARAVRAPLRLTAAPDGTPRGAYPAAWLFGGATRGRPRGSPRDAARQQHDDARADGRPAGHRHHGLRRAAVVAERSQRV